ncbi:MAG: toll/interleukin-1 receptor domain-containing protein [Anaerolineae bacterium]|nr:toll/interleukin-1 receptor domain-containing protein [Anaerolineae bacterium]
MEENPLKLQPPSEDKPLERLVALAYDIAWGALKKEWTSFFRVAHADDHGEIVDNGMRDKLPPKWGNYHNHYAVPLLASLGYLRRASTDSEGITHFEVTPKAYALLEKHKFPPSVFISYAQDQSSALALLVEARLKLRDNNINVFIDKLLVGGDDWKNRLENTIRQSRYFICLINPNTLSNSSMVQQEIDWALDANCIFLAICHNGYKIDPTYPSKLRGKQAIVANHESAKGYESAISDLLNSMGYSTY